MYLSAGAFTIVIKVTAGWYKPLKPFRDSTDGTVKESGRWSDATCLDVLRDLQRRLTNVSEVMEVANVEG
jgi:hypothetical protein